MRISGTMLASVILLTASVTYSIAEDLTLTTSYPSPRGVYSEVLANKFYAFNAGPAVPDPANRRFLDPDGTSRLQNVQFAGSLTLGPAGVARTISTWEDALQDLPAGVVLMFDALVCPGGYTPIVGADLGRFPLIANVPGGPDMRGGTLTTDEGDALTVAASGATLVAAETHVHPVTPPFMDFVFCQRD